MRGGFKMEGTKISRKMISMLMALVMVLVCIGFMPATASSPRLNALNVSAPVNLGSPFPAGAAVNTFMSATTRQGTGDILLTVAYGSPNSILNVICISNPLSPRVLETHNVQTGTTWEYAIDSLGRVYFAGFGNPETTRIYRYSPNNPEGQRLQFFTMNGRGAVTGMAVDSSNNVFFTNTRTNRILRFNANNNTFTDFGVIFPTSGRIRSIAYHNGFLYGGEEGTLARFFRMNVNTRAVNFIPAPAGVTNISHFYSMRVVGNFLFTLIRPSWSMGIFDLTTQTWVANPASSGRLPTGNINGFVYFTRADRGFQRFNLSTRQIESLGATPAAFPNHGIQGMGLANITHSNPNLNGQIFVSIQSGSRHIDFINFATRTRTRVNDIIVGAQPSVQLLKFAGDYFFASSYMGGSQGFSRTNVRTNARTVRQMGQLEGMTFYNDRLYLGAYPAAVIHELNPANNQSIQLYTTGHRQDRPFTMHAQNGMLLVGTVGNSGNRNGALTIQELGAGGQRWTHHVIDRSVTGIAYRDGRAYVAASIHGGQGTTPNQTRALLFIYDIAQRRVITEATPLAVPHIGELAFAPNGRLWGIAGGTIIEINPTNLSIISQTQINTGGNDGNWRPRYMYFDSTGILYANPGGTLVAFDTDTRQWRNLASGVNVRSFSVNAAGDRIVYTNTTNRAAVFRIDISNGNPLWVPPPPPPLGMRITNVSQTQFGANSSVTVNLTGRLPQNANLVLTSFDRNQMLDTIVSPITQLGSVTIGGLNVPLNTTRVTARVENAQTGEIIVPDETFTMQAREAHVVTTHSTHFLDWDASGRNRLVTPLAGSNLVLDSRGITNNIPSVGGRHRMFFLTFDVSEFIDTINYVEEIRLVTHTTGDGGANTANSEFNVYLLNQQMANHILEGHMPTNGAALDLGFYNVNQNAVWQHRGGLLVNTTYESPDILPQIRAYLQQNPSATTVALKVRGTNSLGSFLSPAHTGSDSLGRPHQQHLRITMPRILKDVVTTQSTHFFDWGNRDSVVAPLAGSNLVLDSRNINNNVPNVNGRHRMFFLTFDLSEYVDIINYVDDIRLVTRTNGDGGANSANSEFNVYLFTPQMANHILEGRVPTNGAALDLGFYNFRQNAVWQHRGGLLVNTTYESPNILPQIREYLQQNPGATTVALKVRATNGLAGFLSPAHTGSDDLGRPHQQHLRITARW